MLNVTVCGNTYACAVAIKGPDYVHLVDDSGIMIAAFEGVSNFNGFSITGGSWSTPKSLDDCSVAVVREDGTIATCGNTAKQFMRGGKAFKGEMILTNGVQYGTELPASGVEGQVFFKLN